MSSPRKTAIDILCRTLKKQACSVAFEPDAEGAAFVKMLVLTVLRRYAFLNRVCSSFMKKEPAAETRIILAAAAAELFFMDTPDYAVIDSYVEIVKKTGGKYVSGFVNAILRNIVRGKDAFINDTEKNLFPAAYAKILKDGYSSEQILRMEKMLLREPPLNLQVKQNAEIWAQKLGGRVVQGNCIVVENAGKIENLPGYHDGEWWVQDIAAALPVMYFSDIRGKRVLDLCAAPGGKTAQLLAQGAVVTSLDCDAFRLEILRQNIARLKLSQPEIVCDDVLHYLENFNGQPFDAVLLDAPCSATGIFRRHPEVIHGKTMADVKKQAALQREILNKLSLVLVDGGELVYSTCSLAQTEGERQIRDFIASSRAFSIVPLSNPVEPQCVTSEGFMRLLPYHYGAFGGCDGFFIAKLRKEG